MQKDLSLVIGKEVSAELLKELKIKTIEEYNEFIKEGKDNKEKNNLKKNNIKRVEKISKTKMKEKLRKKEMVINKKIKNEMRSKILESLEQHNKVAQEKNILQGLDSSKYLGQKRKMSKDKDKLPKNEINNFEGNIDMDNREHEEEDSDSVSELSVNNKHEDKNKGQEETIINKDNIDILIDETATRNKIIQEIRNYRSTIELTEGDGDLENDFIDLNLPIPSKDKLVLIQRTDKIQTERLNLPIVKHEYEIMDKINSSLVTVICGETGSGKSTQISQFLYEYGYKGIAITQPRRIAAISLATRVSNELGTKLGEEVGYQVRYDSHNISSSTLIRYVTDGILLKEIENDSLLLKYSVIIIDEAHERTINTDIIIGLLSKVVKFRYILSKNKTRLKNSDSIVSPLRMVIMSATMRVDEFLNSDIFKPNITPSFIKVEARQFPVTVYHNKRTNDNYLEEALKTCCKIHQKLPVGGILIFVTGKKEITQLCAWLGDELDKNEISGKVDESKDVNYDIFNNNNNDLIHNDSGSDSDTKENNNKSKVAEKKTKVIYTGAVILPLYSSLPQEQQLKIFQSIPENKRLIVVATNVAETSLTIPGIRYVIDTGKAKKRLFKQGLSFSTFNIEWISQASAEQRTGRAGRTGPGYCYRLYSNGLFGKMEKYTEPQILSTPLDQTILYLKYLGVKDINKFPFLTFPDKNLVDKALRHLIVIKAVKSEENLISKFRLVNNLNDVKYNDSTTITEVGQLMIKFPIPPRYSRMLILGNKLGLIEYSIFLISVLNMENLFVFENRKIQDDNEVNNVNNKSTKFDLHNILDSKMINPFSDALTYLNIIVSLYKFTNLNEEKSLKEFCFKYNLNIKKIKELIDLISQIARICQQIFKCDQIYTNFTKLSYPNETQQTLLTQILLSAFIENIARRKVIMDQVGNESDKIIKKETIYESNESDEKCKIHSLSLLSKSTPDFIMYKEIIKEDNKKYPSLICNTIIKPEWIYNLGGEIVTSKLLATSSLNEPFYNKTDDQIYCFVDLNYGYRNWLISNVRVEMNKEDDNYIRYFCRFLLEGKVFEEFKKYTKYYNSDPKIITNQLSLAEKVTRLVLLMKINKIFTSESLLNKWLKDKHFLKDVYIKWIDNNQIRKQILDKWPLINLK